jgi:hypothetical protein
MHVVEVHRPNAELATAMAQMRTWLDNQAVQPSLFEIAFLPGRESHFHLHFKNPSEASVFADVFDGALLDRHALDNLAA